MKKYALLTLTVLFASMFFLPSIVTVAENYDGSEQPTNDGFWFDEGNLRYGASGLIGVQNVDVYGFADGHITDEEAEIPSVVEHEDPETHEVHSYAVNGICDRAFSGCNIKTIIIPCSVKHIGVDAFKDIKFTQTDGTTEINEEDYSQLLPGSTYSGDDHVLVRQSITVSFDADGGEVPESIQVGHNEPYGDLPVLEREGAEFNGWYLKDGTTEITSESICTMTEDHTLYAHWTPIVPPTPPTTQVTITFDTDGGSECQPITIEQGAAIGELPTPTKDGFNFAGWFTDDGVKVDENTTFDKDTTLHAHWVETPAPTPADYTWIIVCVIVLIILIFGGAILYCQYK